MTETGTTIVIMVVMVDGVIMMDGVIEVAAVDGSRVPILAFTLDRLTPPTDTMRILLHMGITDTPHTGTTADTRTEDDGGQTHAAHNTYTGKGDSGIYRNGKAQLQFRGVMIAEATGGRCWPDIRRLPTAPTPARAVLSGTRLRPCATPNRR